MRQSPLILSCAHIFKTVFPSPIPCPQGYNYNNNIPPELYLYSYQTPCF